MIIDYEKRKSFNDNEIDLIYNSTSSKIVKRLISHYKNNFNQYIINIITHIILIITFILFSYYSIYNDYKSTFVYLILLDIYLVIELIFLLFDKYLYFSLLIDLILDKYYKSHNEREMQRRLARRFRIKISYNDYCLINGQYIKNDQIYEGLDLISIKNKQIYLNDNHMDYIRNKNCNYCEIIEFLQNKINI